MEENKIVQSSLRKYIVLILLIVFGYLVHVCVIPYIRIGNVAPSFLFTVIAIVTVAYGKLRAFWVGCCYGILMEIMLPSVQYLNLALYPLLTLFISFIFADKSQQRLAYERSMNRQNEKRSNMPLSRTVGCAAVLSFVYEAINIIYIFIGGTPLESLHIRRGLLTVILTVILTVVVMLPVRRLVFGRWDTLSFRKRKKITRQPV